MPFRWTHGAICTFCPVPLPHIMIGLQNLTKTYTFSYHQKKQMAPQFTGDTIDAIDGIPFRCKRGRIYGLLGPDGAGETTTLRMIPRCRPRPGAP